MTVTIRIPTFTSRKQLEHFLAAHYRSDIDLFISTINTTLNRYLSSNLKEAGLLIKKIKQSKRFIPAQHQPQVLAFEARYLHWTGRHIQAEKKYQQAVALAKEQRNWNAVARISQGLADVLMYLGKYQAARDIGRKSLRYFRRKNMRSLTGKMLTNLGNIYHRMDRNYVALDYYNKARQIFLEKQGIPLAIVEYNRANVYTNLHEYTKAAEQYQKAFELYEQAGHHLFAAKAKYSLGYLHFLTGRYSDALQTLEWVYDIFTGLGDKQAAAITNLDLAEINLHINQYSSAIMLAERIIPVFHKLGMRYEQARAYYFSARSFLALGDYHLVSRQLIQAQRLCKREKNKLWLGMVQLAFSDLYYIRRRYTKAYRAAVAARQLFQRSGDRRRITDAEIQIVKARLHMNKQTPKAINKLQTQKLTSYQRYNLNRILGWNTYKQGNFKTALSYFQKAMAAAEKMFIELPADEVRFFFSRDKFTVFYGTIACLLELGKVNAAFSYYLRMLEKLQYNHTSRQYQQSKKLQQLLIKQKNLRASLINLHRLPGDEQNSHQSKSSYLKTEYRLWELEKKIRAVSHTKTKQVTPTSAIYVADFSKQLQPDETAICYFIADSTIGAFFLTRHQTGYQPLNVSPMELTTLIRELHFILEQGLFGRTMKHNNMTIIRHYLKKIYRLIFLPLQKHIIGRRVLFLLDGPVSQIPFTALINENDQWLKNVYHISIIVHPDNITKRTIPPKNISACHNTILAVPSTHLPAIEKECKQIQGLYNHSTFVVDAGTSHLKNALQESDGFLHIATHASYSPENPLFSRLLMTDGPFFPFDLFHIDVRTELVNLSGCQTASSGVYYGNSFSLARSFNQAGCRYVLATLWQVNDSVSMKFMNEFYTDLKQHNQVLTAYRTALDNLSRETINPVFWSPFILLGV